MAEQEDQQNTNSLTADSQRESFLADATCPRCGTKMRWLRRRNIFFCDTDGYILTANDPYLKKGEVVDPYNAGGEYNQ